jgi:hypothetical protein
VTSDCYAILGVSPTAENVVIGAAYRALMRHYHPDTNSDPEAQARAREITAAYAVLRDPARRAEYDARRAEADDFWPVEEPQRRPPPMRAAGIASAALAVALVGAVWMSPAADRDNPTVAPPTTHASTKAEPMPAGPPKALEPEAQRLARLVPPVSPPPPAAEADLAPVPPLDPSPVPDEKALAMAPKPKAVQPKALPRPAPQVVKAIAPAAAPKSERVATLDRMSAGFFSQSMTHADIAKKTLLVAARDRSEAERKACRSDSCVADAYVRQIRATSAIMEGKAGPRN